MCSRRVDRPSRPTCWCIGSIRPDLSRRRLPWRAPWRCCCQSCCWLSDGRSSGCSARRPLLRTALLAITSLAMLVPFIYMISVSFMGEAELLRWPPAVLPDRLETGNYAAAFQALPYARVFMNTAILAACVMVGQVLTSAAAGYAFARMRFPGRDRVFTALLATSAIPAILLLLPRYLLIDALGWMEQGSGRSSGVSRFPWRGPRWLPLPCSRSWTNGATSSGHWSPRAHRPWRWRSSRLRASTWPLQATGPIRWLRP